MNHLTSLLTSLALALTATLCWAEPPAETTEAPTGVVEGVAADASPEMQAERDEFVAQWERAARAAGIDPESVEAGAEQDSTTK